jgi:hypothetical protein
MALIRNATVDNNVGGRSGCQVMSPRTGQIYYCSIEGGMITLRRWDKGVLGQDGPIAVTPTGISADFANEHEVCVTVSGFHAGTNDSCLATYLIEVSE